MSSSTALLIIDTQVGLIEPAYQGFSVLEQIRTLLDKARAARVPVIYMQHDGPQGSDLEVDTSGWHIHPSIAPQEGEPVVRKRASDSFYQTTLAQELETRGIHHLIVTGGQTEYCVDTSVRRAVSQGYDVTLVGDAHTTYDNQVLTAAQIIAHHNTLLDGFCTDEACVSVKAAQDIEL